MCLSFGQRILCDEIAGKYGEKQLTVAIEEMAELTQALTKYIRQFGGGQAVRKSQEEFMAEITEEIADVEIMLEQVKYILDVSDDEVRAIAWKKLKRTKETERDKERR